MKSQCIKDADNIVVLITLNLHFTALTVADNNIVTLEHNKFTHKHKNTKTQKHKKNFDSKLL